MPLNVVNYARNQKAGGKFVIFRDEADPDSGVMVLSDFSRDYQHADVVRRWRLDRDVTPEAAGLRVAGGGWWKLEDDCLVLYGQSAAYGEFDARWVRERAVAGSFFSETRIDVQ